MGRTSQEGNLLAEVALFKSYTRQWLSCLSYLAKPYSHASGKQIALIKAAASLLDAHQIPGVHLV